MLLIFQESPNLFLFLLLVVLFLFPFVHALSFNEHGIFLEFSFSALEFGFVFALQQFVLALLFALVLELAWVVSVNAKRLARV